MFILFIYVTWGAEHTPNFVIYNVTFFYCPAMTLLPPICLPFYLQTSVLHVFRLLEIVHGMFSYVYIRSCFSWTHLGCAYLYLRIHVQKPACWCSYDTSCLTLVVLTYTFVVHAHNCQTYHVYYVCVCFWSSCTVCTKVVVQANVPQC
jgi:hypothetical protein